MKVKLAIDFGQANMKMMGITNNQMIKKIIPSKATTEILQDKNVVEYDNKKICLGTGEFLVTPDKSDRLYILESIFLATELIYGQLNDNFEVELAIGLPLTQFDSVNKNIYEDKLNKQFKNQSFTAKVNNKELTIKIKLIKVYAEGYSGFVGLIDTIDTESPIAIVDIGYKTTDVVGISKDINGDLVIDHYDSIFTGMRDVFLAIRKAFYNSTGAYYDLKIIEDAIIKNESIPYNSDRGRISANIYDYLNDGQSVVSNIFNFIETDILTDLKARSLYLIGGGVEIVNAILNTINNKDKKKTIQSENLNLTENAENNIPMFANVKGYLDQLILDTMEIVESEEVFKSDKKLQKTVAVTEE